MKALKVFIVALLTIPCLFLDFGTVLTETVTGAMPGSVLNELKLPKIWGMGLKMIIQSFANNVPQEAQDFLNSEFLKAMNLPNRTGLQVGDKIRVIEINCQPNKEELALLQHNIFTVKDIMPIHTSDDPTFAQIELEELDRYIFFNTQVEKI